MLCVDVFVGLFERCSGQDDIPDVVMPTIHCYCFSNAPEDDRENDILERMRLSLSIPHAASIPECTIRKVRSVAPNKDMYCASFPLPRSVAFQTLPETKKRRIQT